MDTALRHLTMKARSVREMEEYLDRQHYGEYEVAQVTERLQELGYLDDTAYARDFIRTRLAAKPVSRRKLYEQLVAHKLPREIAEEAVAEIGDDVENANASLVAEKFARQFAHLPEIFDVGDDQNIFRLYQRKQSLHTFFDHGMIVVKLQQLLGTI